MWYTHNLQLEPNYHHRLYTYGLCNPFHSYQYNFLFLLFLLRQVKHLIIDIYKIHPNPIQLSNNFLSEKLHGHLNIQPHLGSHITCQQLLQIDILPLGIRNMPRLVSKSRQNHKAANIFRWGIMLFSKLSHQLNKDRLL